MTQQHGIYLGRIDVDPAGDDQVRAPVGEVQVAVLVDVTHVTQGEEVARVSGCRLVGILVVLEAKVGVGTDIDDAYLTGR
jgi:hypothetical protein